MLLASPSFIHVECSAVLSGSLTVYICIVEVRYNTRLPVFWVALKRSGLTDGRKRPQVDSFLKSKGRGSGGGRSLHSLRGLFKHFLLLRMGRGGGEGSATRLSFYGFRKRSSAHQFLVCTCEWAETRRHKRVRMFAAWSFGSTPKPPGFHLVVMA